MVAGKALFRDGYDTVTVLTVLDEVAPKAADTNNYLEIIFKEIKKDPQIEKIIYEQHKKAEKSKDEGLSL